MKRKKKKRGIASNRINFFSGVYDYISILVFLALFLAFPANIFESSFTSFWSYRLSKIIQYNLSQYKPILKYPALFCTFTNKKWSLPEQKHHFSSFVSPWVIFILTETEKDNSFKIHKDIPSLERELFKVFKGIAIPILYGIIPLKFIGYDLTYQTEFSVSCVNTSHFRLNYSRYFTSIVCNMVSPEFKCLNNVENRNLNLRKW